MNLNFSAAGFGDLLFLLFCEDKGQKLLCEEEYRGEESKEEEQVILAAIQLYTQGGFTRVVLLLEISDERAKFR